MPTIHYTRGLGDSGPRVFLAIPTGSGSVSAHTLKGVFEAATMFGVGDIRCDLHIEAGNCHVDDARNSAVREFLKTDCTDLVFIDDDVGFEPENLYRLVTLDRDVVGGVYPKKDDAEDFPVFLDGGPLYAEADGCVEVQGLPTGFMRIRRHVLEKLAEQAQSFIGQAGDTLPYHVIFERTITGGRRWSGDYAFCQKWRALGGKLYTDPEMMFTHTGAKTWGGSLGAFWRRKHGVDPLTLAPNPKAFEELWLAHDNRQWSAKPPLLAKLWELARDGIVLETGSGLSSYVMARAGAEVHCLEHDPAWAARTRELCKGLNVTVHEMPLKDGWYDGEIPVRPWTLAVNDGPPRTLGNRLKLYEHVGDCPVIADDVDEAHAALLGGEATDGFCIGKAA